MGLALAIDYTLLIISRYRDELAEGADRDRALVRTMATAGRTVLFSAMTVALSMVAMVLFPMYFLKSFAYAGIAVVAFAAVAAIVVAPAAIVLLGDRLDSLDVRRLARRVAQPARAGAQAGRADVLVPLHEIRDAPGDSDRPRGRRAAARCSAPRSSASSGASPTTACCRSPLSARQVGDELRNDFAVDSATQRHRRDPGHRRGDLRPTSTTTPRRCPRCPTCRRCPRPAAPSSTARPSARRRRPPGSRTAARSHRRQHRAAVHRRLRSPTRPVARREPPGRQTGAADRVCADQPRQLRGDHRPGCRWCSA